MAPLLAMQGNLYTDILMVDELNSALLSEVSVLPGPTAIQFQRNTQRSTLIIN